MGIRGLFTYIQSFVEDSLEWHKLCGCKLIIDGNNLAYEIYNNSSGLHTAFGGDYDKYASFVEDFFKKLIQCKVEPYVIMDGGHPMHRTKFKTVYSRMTSQIEACLRVNPDNYSVTKIFPILARSVFVNVVQKLGIIVLQTDFEADDEIVVLAKRLDAYVLSNDSDFYLFDVPFILLNSVNLKCIQREKSSSGKSTKFIPCYRFNVKIFSEITNVHEELLPILAPVLGNDFLHPRLMKEFYLHIAPLKPQSPKISERHKIIISVIKWLSTQTESPTSVLENIVTLLSGSISSRNINNLRSVLRMYFPSHSSLEAWVSPHNLSCPALKSKTSISSYASSSISRIDFKRNSFIPQRVKWELDCTCRERLETDIVQGGHLPEWFIRAFRLQLIPPLVSDMLNKNYFFTLPQIEMRERKSIYLRLETMIRRIRRLLWSSLAESLKMQCVDVEKPLMVEDTLEAVCSVVEAGFFKRNLEKNQRSFTSDQDSADDDRSSEGSFRHSLNKTEQQRNESEEVPQNKKCLDTKFENVSDQSYVGETSLSTSDVICQDNNSASEREKSDSGEEEARITQDNKVGRKNLNRTEQQEDESEEVPQNKKCLDTKFENVSDQSYVEETSLSTSDVICQDNNSASEREKSDSGEEEARITQDNKVGRKNLNRTEQQEDESEEVPQNKKCLDTKFENVSDQSYVEETSLSTSDVICQDNNSASEREKSDSGEEEARFTQDNKVGRKNLNRTEQQEDESEEVPQNKKCLDTKFENVSVQSYVEETSLSTSDVICQDNNSASEREKSDSGEEEARITQDNKVGRKNLNRTEQQEDESEEVPQSKKCLDTKFENVSDQSYVEETSLPTSDVICQDNNSASEREKSDSGEEEARFTQDNKVGRKNLNRTEQQEDESEEVPQNKKCLDTKFENVSVQSYVEETSLSTSDVICQDNNSASEREKSDSGEEEARITQDNKVGRKNLNRTEQQEDESEEVPQSKKCLDTKFENVSDQSYVEETSLSTSDVICQDNNSASEREKSDSGEEEARITQDNKVGRKNLNRTEQQEDESEEAPQNKKCLDTKFENVSDQSYVEETSLSTSDVICQDNNSASEREKSDSGEEEARITQDNKVGRKNLNRTEQQEDESEEVPQSKKCLDTKFENVSDQSYVEETSLSTSDVICQDNNSASEREKSDSGEEEAHIITQDNKVGGKKRRRLKRKGNSNNRRENVFDGEIKVRKENVNFEMFRETNRIPVLRWFIRNHTDLLGRELPEEHVEKYQDFPSLFQVNKLPLPEKKNVFYKMAGLEIEFGEALPTNIEFILFCISFWRLNYDKHVDDHTLLAVLMCVIMFCVVDGKVGRTRSTKSFQTIECSSKKVQAMLKSGTLPDISTMSIGALIQNLTVEECRMASLSLYQFHAIDPMDTRKNYNRIVIHTFSEYQASIYFLQVLNSLLCFPFPSISVDSFWSGTFCYNIRKCFCSKFGVRRVLSTIFHKNTRIIHLFLKLHSLLQSPLNLAGFEETIPNHPSNKHNEISIQKKKLGLKSASQMGISTKKKREKKRNHVSYFVPEYDTIENPTEEDKIMMAENKFSALLIK